MTSQLASVKTHDVPALRATLELQLSQIALLQAGGGVAFSQNPESPDFDPFNDENGTRQHRLHGHLLQHTNDSGAQTTFALETWQFGQQIRDDNPELRRMLDIASALARWNSVESSHSISPLAAQTRRIVLEKIIATVKGLSSRLRLQVAQCAVLVLAFGCDMTTAERCHKYTTPILQKFLNWNTDPVLDWRLQAIQVWASMFTRYSRAHGSIQRRPTRAEVWKIYAALLQMWRLEEN